MTTADDYTISQLINQVRLGEPGAYAEVVHRFQDMAVGYAYAKLGDLYLAEDVAQEAFIQAYFDLPELRDPAAFPGWFRRIVFSQITRLTRSKKVDTVPLDMTADTVSNTQTPAEIATRVDIQRQVSAAISALPIHQREVVTLFYMGQYSQKEISHFLGIPVATVKTRLYAARQQLKSNMVTLIQDNLLQQRPSRNDTFVKEFSTMNLALAIVTSCGTAGCRVKLIETDMEIETRYSLKIQDQIKIRPQQTVVINQTPTPPETVYRLFYSQVKAINGSEIVVERLRDDRDRGKGDVVKAALETGLDLDLKVGDDVYGRDVIFGLVKAGKPADPAQLLATITPRVKQSEEKDTFQLPPNSAAAHTNRGNIYLDQGNVDAAIAAYNQAITVNSKYVVAYTNRGHAYKAMGLSAKAKVDYEKAITLLKQPVPEILPANHLIWRDSLTESFVERSAQIRLRRAKKHLATLDA